MRWVLTRELEDGRALAEELGLEVVPCIERVELDWPAWPPSPLVFVTSAVVAKRLLRLTAPPGTRIAALAPATSALLRHAVVTAEGGAVALAEAVKAWATKDPGALPALNIFYPTSDKGLAQPEQAEAVRILETVGTVHRHVVYETRAPAGLREALGARRGAGFVFFSPSAVQNFMAAGGEAGRVLCVGGSTARAWPRPDEVLLATPETVRTVLKENPP